MVGCRIEEGVCLHYLTDSTEGGLRFVDMVNH